MAKPIKPLADPIPVLQIKSCYPTLENENKVYARIIKGIDINNNSYTIRERTGIDIENYIDKPLECILEIIKATFYIPKDQKNNPPENAIRGTFLGFETGYKFFQELVSMVEGETGDAADDDLNSDEYEALATKLFNEWGVYGFGLDIYKDKPYIKTDIGSFFLNEFIFEDLVDSWLESESTEKQVCFIIEELLLHGIKPYEGKWEKKKNKSQFEPKEGESYIVGKPRFLEKYG